MSGDNTTSLYVSKTTADAGPDLSDTAIPQVAAKAAKLKEDMRSARTSRVPPELAEVRESAGEAGT